MEEEEVVTRILHLLQRFLDQNLEPEVMIEQYNALITQKGIPWDAASLRMERIDSFHNELAFFVEDPISRSEHPAYYDGRELRSRVKNFVSEMLTWEY